MPNKLTINEILDRFKIAHNNKYEYDLVEYKSNKDKVTVICPYHGRFESIVKNHLDGHGCKKCINFSKKDYSVDIGKYRIVHGDKYDYSLVKYTNEKGKIEIIKR